MGNKREQETQSRRGRCDHTKRANVAKVAKVVKSVAKRIHDVAKAIAMQRKRFYREQQRVARNAML